MQIQNAAPEKDDDPVTICIELPLSPSFMPNLNRYAPFKSF